MTTLQPKIVHVDGGEAVTPFGLKMRVLIAKDDTGGAFSAISCVHQPGEGPIAHMHDHQDEYFYVIDGTYQLVINGGEPQLVGAGSLIYVPRGNKHGFKNVGNTPAKMIDWSLPGGQDGYFREISDLQAGTGFTGNGMNEINKKHHTTYYP
jgi:mannose-6-phosphate isomerase-like protein (cupin superfamily)